ncbi:Uncharacterised protein [Staphylococcus microti]|uniref:Uncharacterized protein n=1 Tax=Staphylococcus microti TaxID=569857 RepID=A0A380GTF3_9STAP|nr:Uncharacterised protein [Staphylococcus microti]
MPVTKTTPQQKKEFVEYLQDFYKTHKILMLPMHTQIEFID